ncbi:MAG: glutamate dehydrogenase, partial [Planctomycetes bacterium]|nr:glutamate dehydrogenase [Planctomycetota bacterium]
CATQNELDREDAGALMENGCICISEGANMPTTLDATEIILDKGALFGPGKAANAGGVATSGLEMSQNSLRYNWTREEVDDKLHGIMTAIHSQCVAHGKKGNFINYVDGANIAGFVKIADSMLDQGVV